MKTTVSSSLFFLGVTTGNAQEKASDRTAIVPFQGTKHFCSNYKPVNVMSLSTALKFQLFINIGST
jgi:hypothetical protein